MVHLLKKVGSFVLTMLIAMVLIFIVLDVLPGDPALVILGPDAQPDTLMALRQQLGLDASVGNRFLLWVWDLVHGDLGNSYAYRVPVTGLIGERLAVTLPLALIAITLTVLFALIMGVYAATNNGRLRGKAIMAFTQFGIAVPSFWFGLLLILFFSIYLDWMPAGGFPGWSSGFWPALQSLILPAVALALVQAAILTRVTRAALLEVLHEDFIRTAQSTGLSRRQVLWRHALQNALVPVATVMGLQFASLLAGTIVIENVFALPGLGRLLFQAVEQRDLIVVRAMVLLLVAVVVAVNYLVDIAYLFIDPRLRIRVSGESP
ncbi:MAG: ABC transporter permease [Pusillimonas sp.]